jgi:hypothetical protein
MQAAHVLAPALRLTQNKPGQHGSCSQPAFEHAKHLLGTSPVEQPSVPQHSSCWVQASPLAVQQRPPAQVFSAGQAVVQSPQRRGSVVVSVHSWLQQIVLVGQSMLVQHWPARMHAVPHRFCPDGQPDPPVTATQRPL